MSQESKLDSLNFYKETLNSESDINEIIDSGCHAFYIENGMPKNVPSYIASSSRGLLIVIRCHSHILQIINGFDSIAFRFVVHGITDGWIKL